MTADEAYEGAFVILRDHYARVVCYAILNGKVNKHGMIMLAWQGPYGEGRWIKSRGGGWFPDHRTQLHPDQDRMLADFTAWRLLNGDNNA